MDAKLILWPLLLQVLLTIAIYLLLAARKIAAIRAGGVDRKATALDNKAWPPAVLQVSNNLNNQFEAPVLFYALCLTLLAIGEGGALALGLAWAFVLSRILHAWVHVHSNYVPHRFRLFVFGLLVLLAMALLAGWQLASG